jgi:hypothetical protein
MKKLIILGTIITFAAALLTGCSAVFHTTGTGQIIDKTYDFKDFTNIELSSSYQYDFRQADTYSVVISAPQSTLDRVDIRQSGNTLVVSMRYIPFSSSNARITITLPQLNKLTVSGSCDGSATGFSSNNDLEIGVSGSSRLDADFKAAKTGINVSSSSYISGNMTASDTTINISASSRMNMDIVTGKTSIAVSSSSNATGKLTAADTEIKVHNSSNLNMTMQTGNTTMEVSGSSTVRGSLDALDSAFTINNSSRCELTGSAGNSTILATGSSNMISPGLILKSADVTLESSSHAGIFTNGAMSIDISGSSTLDYYGNPSIGKTNVNSSSRLNRK